MWMSVLCSAWPGFDLTPWILLGVVLDLLIGETTGRHHPVRWIGTFIQGLEHIIRRRAWSPAGLRAVGIFLTVTVVLTVFLSVAVSLALAHALSVWVFRVWVALLTYWGLAIRGLADAALAVYHPLVGKQMETARQNLQMIVGRNTARLSASEIIRATVESVAENTCDAIVAPLLFAFIGGPAWLWAYKAVNTLDSMVGYRNEKYEHLGWFSAKTDDWFNWIPARISGVAIAMAAATEGRFHQSYTIMREDGRRHPSPNSGISEAAMAGALGVLLGGPNLYHGVVSLRPRIGRPEYSLNPATIIHAISISIRATLLVTVVLVLMVVLITGRWL